MGKFIPTLMVGVLYCKRGQMWSICKNPSDKQINLILSIVVQLLKGQKTIMATVKDVSDKIAQLGADVSAEVDAAKAAILAAQAGDPAALDAVVASLDSIDKAVTNATVAFSGTSTSPTTQP